MTTSEQDKNWQIACGIVGARLAYVRKIAAALNAKDEAASDMLAALQEVDRLWGIDALSFVEEMSAQSPVGIVWEKIRDAIAKATKP